MVKNSATNIAGLLILLLNVDSSIAGVKKLMYNCTSFFTIFPEYNDRQIILKDISIYIPSLSLQMKSLESRATIYTFSHETDFNVQVNDYVDIRGINDKDLFATCKYPFDAVKILENWPQFPSYLAYRAELFKFCLAKLFQQTYFDIDTVFLSDAPGVYLQEFSSVEVLGKNGFTLQWPGSSFCLSTIILDKLISFQIRRIQMHSHYKESERLIFNEENQTATSVFSYDIRLRHDFPIQETELYGRAFLQVLFNNNIKVLLYPQISMHVKLQYIAPECFDRRYLLARLPKSTISQPAAHQYEVIVKSVRRKFLNSRRKIDSSAAAAAAATTTTTRRTRTTEAATLIKTQLEPTTESVCRGLFTTLDDLLYEEPHEAVVRTAPPRPSCCSQLHQLRFLGTQEKLLHIIYQVARLSSATHELHNITKPTGVEDTQQYYARNGNTTAPILRAAAVRPLVVFTEEASGCTECLCSLFNSVEAAAAAASTKKQSSRASQQRRHELQGAQASFSSWVWRVLLAGARWLMEALSLIPPSAGSAAVTTAGNKQARPQCGQLVGENSSSTGFADIYPDFSDEMKLQLLTRIRAPEMASSSGEEESEEGEEEGILSKKKGADDDGIPGRPARHRHRRGKGHNVDSGRVSRKLLASNSMGTWKKTGTGTGTGEDESGAGNDEDDNEDDGDSYSAFLSRVSEAVRVVTFDRDQLLSECVREAFAVPGPPLLSEHELESLLWRILHNDLQPHIENTRSQKDHLQSGETSSSSSSSASSSSSSKNYYKASSRCTARRRSGEDDDGLVGNTTRELDPQLPAPLNPSPLRRNTKPTNSQIQNAGASTRPTKKTEQKGSKAGKLAVPQAVQAKSPKRASSVPKLKKAPIAPSDAVPSKIKSRKQATAKQGSARLDMPKAAQQSGAPGVAGTAGSQSQSRSRGGINREQGIGVSSKVAGVASAGAAGVGSRDAPPGGNTASDSVKLHSSDTASSGKVRFLQPSPLALKERQQQPQKESQRRRRVEALTLPMGFEWTKVSNTSINDDDDEEREGEDENEGESEREGEARDDDAFVIVKTIAPARVLRDDLTAHLPNTLDSGKMGADGSAKGPRSAKYTASNQELKDLVHVCLAWKYGLTFVSPDIMLTANTLKPYLAPFVSLYTQRQQRRPSPTGSTEGHAGVASNAFCLQPHQALEVVRSLVTAWSHNGRDSSRGGGGLEDDKSNRATVGHGNDKTVTRDGAIISTGDRPHSLIPATMQRLHEDRAFGPLSAALQDMLVSGHGPVRLISQNNPHILSPIKLVEEVKEFGHLIVNLSPLLLATHQTTLRPRPAREQAPYRNHEFHLDKKHKPTITQDVEPTHAGRGQAIPKTSPIFKLPDSIESALKTEAEVNNRKPDIHSDHGDRSSSGSDRVTATVTTLRGVSSAIREGLRPVSPTLAPILGVFNLTEWGSLLPAS